MFNGNRASNNENTVQPHYNAMLGPKKQTVLYVIMRLFTICIIGK